MSSASSAAAGRRPHRQKEWQSSVPTPPSWRAARQLSRAGHGVHVFEEREIKPGGLLRYGIPDFKMEKNFIDRRVRQISDEGAASSASPSASI